MFRCKARKNRTARRIWTYVERCGLKRNTADERFSTDPLMADFSYNGPVEKKIAAKETCLALHIFR